MGVLWSWRSRAANINLAPKQGEGGDPRRAAEEEREPPATQKRLNEAVGQLNDCTNEEPFKHPSGSFSKVAVITASAKGSLPPLRLQITHSFIKYSHCCSCCCVLERKTSFNISLPCPWSSSEAPLAGFPRVVSPLTPAPSLLRRKRYWTSALLISIWAGNDGRCDSPTRKTVGSG